MDIKKISLPKFLIGIGILVIIIIITRDIILETGDWTSFSIDFTDKSAAISAYGSLIGGLLLSLSILVIFYQILLQIKKEKLDKENEVKKNKESLRNRLKLIYSLIDELVKDILYQGKQFEKYCKIKKDNPLRKEGIKYMYFKYIDVFLNLNQELTYQAFEEFKPTDNWQNEYWNIQK